MGRGSFDILIDSIDGREAELFVKVDRESETLEPSETAEKSARDGIGLVAHSPIAQSMLASSSTYTNSDFH